VKDYGVVFTSILLLMIVVIVISYFAGHNPKNEFKDILSTIKFIVIVCFVQMEINVELNYMLHKV
jgi:hypothetical protein